MTEAITLNQGETLSFDAPLHSVQASVGTVIVTDGDDATVVKESDTHDCGDKASLALYSPDGARVGITYSDEVPAPQEAVEKSSGVSAKKGKK